MANDPIERVKARWPDAFWFGRLGDVIWESQDKRNIWIVGDLETEPQDAEGYLGDDWTEAANHPTVVDYWKERDGDA